MAKPGSAEDLPPVYLKFTTDIHSRVKAMAAEKGIKSLPEAYTQAAELWLDWIKHGAIVDTAIGKVSDEERPYVEAVLKFLRSPHVALTPVVKSSLDALVAKFGPKSSV